jgi:hypothetical protein
MVERRVNARRGFVGEKGGRAGMPGLRLWVNDNARSGYANGLPLGGLERGGRQGLKPMLTATEHRRGGDAEVIFAW